MSDLEYRKEGIVSPTSDSPPSYGDSDRQPTGVLTRIVDSFKRDPHQHATPKGVVGADGKVFDVETAAAATAESPLARKLKGRHLQMIAIGGSIGTSYFLDR
jgi:amino acid transporter